MVWYEIIGYVIGAFGGCAGLISIYNAKSNRQTIDIGNMQQMLEEAHKMYDDSAKRYDDKVKEFDDYKATNMKYIAEFKARFAKLEKRLDNAENMTLQLKGVIYHGYRCRYPDNINDCPVLKEYETMKSLMCDGLHECRDGNNEEE